jgi:hypothetical protein
LSTYRFLKIHSWENQPPIMLPGKRPVGVILGSAIAVYSTLPAWLLGIIPSCQAIGSFIRGPLAKG